MSSGLHGSGLVGLIVGVFSLLTGPAAADPRNATLLPEAEQSAWNAIGRVNVAGLKLRSMCTGTLVAPDLVLTAAHCLTLQSGRPARPEDVHFVAGWRGGAFAAHRVAADVRFHPDYDPSQPPSPHTALFDMAFIRLAEPIPAAEIPALPLGPAPDPAAELSIVAYRQDRPHAPSLQTGCSVTWTGPGAIGLDCPVIHGASGAPVLLPGAEGFHVVALIGAAVEDGGATRSLAALVENSRLEAPLED